MSIMDGKVTLVTGGSSGIGRASAVARFGAKVVVAARREDEGEETVRLIQEAGSEGRFIQTDVSKTAEIERLFNEITNAFGGIDYAFNNAGVENPLRPLAEQTEEDFDRVISINLKSVWLCMKHEINQMLKRGGGRNRQ